MSPVPPSGPTASHRPAGTRTPPRHGRLVGRAAELDGLTDLLRRHRVVTLAGAGGIGKTRLAEALAAELAAAPDPAHDTPPAPDVRWVDLAPCASPAEVRHAVARSVGAVEHGGVGDLERIAAALAVLGPTLLVLDNCEHVLDDAAQLVADLAATTSEVTFLATGRVPLGIDGEIVWQLRPLAVPPLDAALQNDAGGDSLHRWPSTELFALAARDGSPGWSPAGDDLDAIARICRLVEGNPLAIRLAAGRARTLPLATIATALDANLDVLARSGSRLQRRHDSITRSLRWSYELLDPTARRLLLMLSVEAGHFDATAAAELMDGDATPSQAMLALSILTEHGLVDREPTGDHHRMLHIVRVFAHDELEATGALDAARARHARRWLERAIAWRSWGETYSTADSIRHTDDIGHALAWAMRHDGDLACRPWPRASATTSR